MRIVKAHVFDFHPLSRLMILGCGQEGTGSMMSVRLHVHSEEWQTVLVAISSSSLTGWPFPHSAYQALDASSVYIVEHPPVA